MPTPSAEFEATLIHLRYAFVDDRRGRALRRFTISRRAIALPQTPSRGGATPGMALRVKRSAWAASALVAVAGFAPLGGCARDAEPATFAVPRAAVADLRMVCPPGTFVGTMTINCPQPIPRAVPIR